MKDVYGLENGSEEHIVDIDNLIIKFKKNGIELLDNLSFDNVYDNNYSLKKRFNLKSFQKEILSMNNILIFNRL